MSGVCLGVAFSVIQAVVPATQFTLAWTHSVEKSRWEEDYRLERGRLVLIAARARGSGAGMEPPPDAMRRDGWWEYRPRREPLPKLVLARAPEAGDYTLCWDSRCAELAALVGPARGAPIELFFCPG